MLPSNKSSLKKKREKRERESYIEQNLFSETLRLQFLPLSRISSSISRNYSQTARKRTDCTHRSIPVIRRPSRFEDSQDCKAQENYFALTVRFVPDIEGSRGSLLRESKKKNCVDLCRERETISFFYNWQKTREIKRIRTRSLSFIGTRSILK